MKTDFRISDVRINMHTKNCHSIFLAPILVDEQFYENKEKGIIIPIYRLQGVFTREIFFLVGP